jgi:hypothetical protein
MAVGVEVAVAVGTAVEVEAVGMAVGVLGLLRFTVGAVVAAGMAEAGLLPIVAWPTWVMGGVAMH